MAFSAQEVCGGEASGRTKDGPSRKPGSECDLTEKASDIVSMDRLGLKGREVRRLGFAGG